MHGNRKVSNRLTDTINFRLTAIQRAALEGAADKEHISMAEAARRALNVGLDVWCSGDTGPKNVS
jgi:hypothetical protein